MSALLQMLSAQSGAANGKNPLWSNVVLALHGDGTNGSTTIIDEKGHTPAITGGAALATAQKKFGTASIYYPGGGGLIYSTGGAVAAFQFAGDFMIRGWVYITGGSGTARSIYDCRRDPGSAEGFVFFLNTSDGLTLYTGTTYLLNSSTAVPTNQWVHVAVTRSGINWYTFQNGALTSSTGYGATNLSDGRCCVGEINTEYQGTASFVGYIDDFEVANGQAVYTAAFTPPTSAFPNS